MDQLKAQRLILRIQTLLDQEQTLSKLESDLIRSYIIQLYDAVTESEPASPVSASATSSHPPQAEQPAAPKPEPVPVIVPPVQQPQPPAAKPVWEPMAGTPTVPETPPDPAPVPDPAPIPTPVSAPPAPDPTPAVPETRSEPTGNFSEALVHLFDPPAHSSPTAAHVVISSIEEVMGLNDRIFTLKDLFGGDKNLFDETLARLNALGSFREARQLLLEGVATRQDWANPERVKMAVEFIRIVRRRYPPES